MAQQRLVDRLATVCQSLDGSFEVDRVPKDDSGDDEIEAARAISLMLEVAITDLAKAIEKDSARQGVFGLAFVEPGMNAPATITGFRTR